MKGAPELWAEGVRFGLEKAIAQLGTHQTHYERTGEIERARAIELAATDINGLLMASEREASAPNE